jgi:hypothetical protein
MYMYMYTYTYTYIFSIPFSFKFFQVLRNVRKGRKTSDMIFFSKSTIHSGGHGKGGCVCVCVCVEIYSIRFFFRENFF